MTDSQAEKWNANYRREPSQPLEAAKVLRENIHLLPKSGKALDLASGRGANARLLAKQKLECHAWDISQIAIEKLQEQATTENLIIHTQTRDVSFSPPEENQFDVIVVSRFLDRNLCPALIAALRPKGLLFYQTFIKDSANENGPRNPNYRLDENELLIMFGALRLIFYREEGTIGEQQEGFRNEAMLIAQKET